MTGTLKAQPAQWGMQEPPEEAVRVRGDLGHPISATPFALIGIESVLDIAGALRRMR